MLKAMAIEALHCFNENEIRNAGGLSIMLDIASRCNNMYNIYICGAVTHTLHSLYTRSDTCIATFVSAGGVSTLISLIINPKFFYIDRGKLIDLLLYHCKNKLVMDVMIQENLLSSLLKEAPESRGGRLKYELEKEIGQREYKEKQVEAKAKREIEVKEQEKNGKKAQREVIDLTRDINMPKERRNSSFPIIGNSLSEKKKLKLFFSAEDESKLLKKNQQAVNAPTATPDSTEEQHDHFFATEKPLRLHNKWRIPYAAITMADRIDDGGFGDVFKGRWQHQPVAIKRAKKSNPTAPGSESRAMRAAREEAHREAQIMADLDHEYVVRFKGLVDEPNYPIMIIMEFVAGGSLYKRLYGDISQIPWQLLLRIAHELTCGLAFLHEKHILHCDIKSKNVLLTESGRAKWCDFGLSKLKQETQGKSRPGTLRWMAPELFLGQPYDEQTDIWALGMLFYELAACEFPFFDKKEEADIIAAIVQARGKGLPVPIECVREQPCFGGLMKTCWKERNIRPTAEILEKRLAEIQTPEETSPKKR